ncbi:MAG: peptidoglycan DD-metalloendopeptidase family protein [Alphaproteobacteria bacterium]
MRRFTLIIGVMALAACTNVVPPPVEFGTPLRSRGAIPAGPDHGTNRPTEAIVRKGDTVYAIARRHKVSPRSIITANGLKAPFAIHPGDKLQVPHPHIHRVKKGETIYGISRGYGVDTTLLARLNGVRAPYTIKIGEELVLPTVKITATPDDDVEDAPPVVTVDIKAEDLPPPPREQIKPVDVVAAAPKPRPSDTPAKVVDQKPVQAVKPPSVSAPNVAAVKPPVKPSKPTPPPSKAAPAHSKPKPALKPQMADTSVSRYGFSWPLRGKILSDYGPKGRGLHNDGVNIRAANGAPVRAAADGTVAYAGNELRGYGNLLLIRHTNGWTSAYAHNAKLLVRRGQEVKRGTVIAKAGRSGGVDTSQLHFEIRRGKKAVDPVRYLP